MNRAAKKRRAKMRTARVTNERILSVLGDVQPDGLPVRGPQIRTGWVYVPMLCGGWELRGPEKMKWESRP